MIPITRLCTEVREDKRNSSPQPLSAYEDVPAYVLLGNPGAGKTTVFMQEAERAGACFVTARDLITFDVGNHPEWLDTTLFIDGLDEIRAGSTDARTPLDRIRAQLDKLGCPRFRLSCREADWLGASDQGSLESVSPDGCIKIFHLEPLTDDNIIDILSEGRSETDARTFVNEAENRGLGELLKNPQTLVMLAKIVTDGNWPDGRTETFDIFCREMLIERNKEHEITAKDLPVNDDQLLEAAGFLCAAQLIAGNIGYALLRETRDESFPYIDDLDYGDISLLTQVAQRNLFKASGEGRIEPFHRHIAEYLAAGYLANQIDKTGLPIGRVFSLITGEDGIVVSELRGLSAWLAARCISERRAVIERDPVGVVLYGDVRAFAVEDKLHLLDGLHREAGKNLRFDYSNWKSPPFGALATPDMKGEFEKILMAPGRGESDQMLAQCVLDAMTHGDKFPTLDDILIGIVRDGSRWSSVRQAALDVFRREIATDSSLAHRMKLLLEEISRRVITDPDDELAGYILMELYPQIVKPEEVFDHLHAPINLNYTGWYRWFWRIKLLEKSSDEDVRQLLDQLVSRPDVGHSSEYRRMSGRLLARGLEVHGESIEADRLYKWLSIGLDRYGFHNRVERAQVQQIRDWLSSRPEVQKSIICAGEEVCRESEVFGTCWHHIRARLYQAEPPDDYGLWCLQRMSALSDDDLARNMLRVAVNSIAEQRGNKGLSLELIEETVAKNDKYKIWWEKLRFCPVDEEDWKIERTAWEFQQDERRCVADKRKERNEWIRHVSSHESALRAGTAPPRLLHELSGVYFGRFLDLEGSTPVERLCHFLGQEDGLVESVLEGFRHSLDRKDAPSAQEIIRLNTQNQTHLLSLPMLAGFAENSRHSPQYIRQLSDSQIEMAVAVYLAEAPRKKVSWYDLLLELRPELVSRILIEYVSAVLRSKKQQVAGLQGILNSLVYKEEYFPVARLATVAMLKVFPARCTNQQLELLNPLLKSSLRHVDRETLLARIEAKLSLRSMNSAQRIYWLATGFLAGPQQYRERFADFIRGDEGRTRHLARFLCDRYEQWSPLVDLPVSTIELFIRVLGRYFAPYSLTGTHWRSVAMDASDFVSNLIDQLASNPAKEVTDTLDSLLGNEGMVKWHNALQQARFQQLAIRREASFRHLEIQQVVSTLNNKPPANAGDLAALVLDILQDMARRIRSSNTDDHKQYWNLKRGSLQPADPRHEDVCRDTLLSGLRQHLTPLGVDAQPEGQCVDDKRSDIRVSVGGDNGFAIPIEIKKNTHEDLWCAIHDQLIAQYTQDPLADGFGIYLVFWFGADKTKKLPPSGKRPNSAEELEQRLRGTLSTDESRKISICVIDVDARSGRASNEKRVLLSDCSGDGTISH